ncbi:SAM-dependent methyltransferase [Sphingomonas kaistensis]|uniref:SAM-dependent methyltransferase n=1 Tax=Sphingomonas kaistensis TaxID=298708 RepID=A0A7X6BHB6_9SPHN|nr:class I SAM-dependent methyltransferase [Sphingomonas kaistensis]NJC06365.1 SAM-dependent methyltransferase [Sphingomonas kaistensis]
MKFTDLFSGHASLYATARPSYPERVIAELASLAPGRSQAWDAGTGNGQSALLLARNFEYVHATDASEAQIAEAFAHERIHYAVEPAEQCSLPDASCDLILAAQAAHWFDPERFVAEVRRVARPGGIVAAIGYGWWYVDPQVDAIIGERLLKPVEPHWLPGNWMLVDGYRDLRLPGEEVRLTPAAIHLAWERHDVEAYVLSWSVVQKLGTDFTADAFAALREMWPDGEKRHVTMPIVSRVHRL